jgi:two-component system NtrC family sensor kinase
MKKLLLFLFLFIPQLIIAQRFNPDSLRQALKNTTVDSVLYNLNSTLYSYYEENNVDSALYFSDRMLTVAKRSNQKLAEASALNANAYQFRNIGQYGKSLQCLTQALTILENPEIEKNTTWFSDSAFTPHRLRLWLLSITHHMYALLMGSTDNHKEEIFHYKEELKISEMADRKDGVQLAYMNLGSVYKYLDMLDSALAYSEKANFMAEKNNFKYYNGWNLGTLGDIYYKMKKDSLALHYYYAGIQNSKDLKNLGSLTSNYSKITNFYLAKKNVDSSLYYAKMNFTSVKSLGTNSNVKGWLADSYENLFGAYNLNGQRDSAFKYLNLAMVYKDSVFNDRLKNLAEFQSLTLSQQRHLQDLENDKIETQNKIRLYSLIAALVVFMTVALLLYRNNRNRKKANKILQSQKEEIEVQKKNVEETLTELKSTQAQLVHSEKMASLGEMTAGIAHEIKNPLNFINNFSEISNELLAEVKTELQNKNEEEVADLIDNLKQNLEKINQHGKRADSIVKGMLLHSRGTSGEKTLTDINDLLDQYVNLAYHGMRATNKEFNITIEKDYDESLEKINVVPQDISRVFLNIINNACYAAYDKKKKDGDGFNPVLKVSTKNLKDKVEIRIGDNGNGIPKDILDKIFQPFFTTKPTGEGTGLGLSLSYDIVVKQHGGEIKIESKEGEGTEFIIQIPVKTQ